MPSINATVEPTRSQVIIQINWSDVPTVTYARVRRTETDGTVTTVRVHTASDTTGEYILLSGGLATLYDTEAPMDVPLLYTTDALGSALTASTTGLDVLASGGDLELKSPLHPWADQRVTLLEPQEPDCVPVSAIFFAGIDVEVRPNRSQPFTVNNRKNPVVANRVRGGINSTLVLISRTINDRNAIIVLNEPGDPLFFQAPAIYAIDDQYISVADYEVSRISIDHRIPWRNHTLPYVEVDRPAGLADGVLGVRWVDLCNLYTTFSAATSAGLTWTGVLLGQGSISPGPPAAFRLYSDIPIDFANYTAIPAGGRTYDGLTEGL